MVKYLGVKLLRFIAFFVVVGATLAFGGSAIAQQNPVPDPESSGVTLGVFAGNAQSGESSHAQLDEYSSKLAGRKPEIVLVFQPWKWEGNYTNFSAADYDAIYRKYPVAMMTWEPWDSSRARCQQGFELDDIIAGKHDAYIRRFARDVDAWGKPLYIRLGHEMNGDWYAWSPACYANTPAKFVRMWRHVHGIFEQQGVTNVKWVWSPHAEYTLDRNYPLDQFYPGNAYTDVRGLDVYNWGNVNGNHWVSFSKAIGNDYAELLALPSNDPVWIAESGTHSAPGSKARWFEEVRKSLKNRYPEVEVFVYFHNNQENGSFRTDTSNKALAAWRRLVNDPYFQRPAPLDEFRGARQRKIVERDPTSTSKVSRKIGRSERALTRKMGRFERTLTRKMGRFERTLPTKLSRLGDGSSTIRISNGTLHLKN